MITHVETLFCARSDGRFTFQLKGLSGYGRVAVERAQSFWRDLSTGGSLTRGILGLHSFDNQGGSDRGDSPGALTDRSLIRRLQGGDNDAATQVYVRYAKRIELLAQKRCAPELRARFDAEDVVQSVFRTFFRRAERGEYVVPDGNELWKLLLVIAMNKIRANSVHHRAAKRDIRHTLSGEIVERSVGGDEAGLAVLRMVVEQALENLPASYRQIVELRIEGYEVAEIARRAGRAKRSVERLLQEFRKALRAQLEGE
jgi:RNA polymerase sigma-70 factor (ECF subfamily)